MLGGSRLIAYYMMLGIDPPGPTPPTPPEPVEPRSFNGSDDQYVDKNSEEFYEKVHI